MSNATHETDQKTNGARRPTQIIEEINRTRDEMDQTLSAIEHRLTPGQLVDQGLDYLKNSGAREYAANLGSSVKTNPLPVTLAGIGLAWMMATSNRAPQASGDTDSGPGIGERMQSAKDTVGGKMQSAKDTVGNKVQSAKDSLSSGMQSARDSASQLGETAGRQIDRARDNWDYMLRENPLVLGAIGLAIGAVAAALAPRTRTENKLMGEARDNLVDQAKQAGSAKLEEAKQAAESVKDAAIETVKGKAEAMKPDAGIKPDTTKPDMGMGTKLDPQELKKPGVTPKKGDGSDGEWPYAASKSFEKAKDKAQDVTKPPPSGNKH